MGKEATKFFENVCQYPNKYLQEIREQVFNSLGIETQDEKLIEYMKESIERFSFNAIETEFLTNIKNIINQEFSKIEILLKSNGEVNYQNIKNSLIEKFSGLKNISITMDDDLKEMSNQMANKFPYIGVSRDDLIGHFCRKQEQLCSLIQESNQKLLDSLIFLTPYFVEEVKDEKGKQPIINSQKKEETSIVINDVMDNIDSKINDMNKIDGLINACKQKYNELQKRFSYLTSGATSNVNSSKIMLEKEEIRKALKQLTELIQKLSASKYATDLMNRYADIQDINLLHQKVISEIAPSSVSAVSMTSTVDNIYGKQFTTDFSQYEMNEINVEEIHQRITNTSRLSELLSIKQQIENAIGNQYYDTNIRLETELTIVIDKIVSLTMRNSKDIDPNNPTPSLNAYIGESKDDVRSLVNSGDFYSILHGIQSQSVEKYRDFIMMGFNAIMTRWQQQAELCTTFIEREKTYQDFVELYENFKDYLPMDVSNMLKINLEDMKRYIEKQRENHTETDGIRYNNEEEQLNNNSMKTVNKSKNI